MTESDKTGHYTVLNSLYRLYLVNQENSEILDYVVAIAWSLGVELNFDYGYHELAELAQGTKASSSDGAEHYIQVIETNLEKLQSQA